MAFWGTYRNRAIVFFVIPVLFPALTSQNVCCEKDLLIEGGRFKTFYLTLKRKELKIKKRVHMQHTEI